MSNLLDVFWWWALTVGWTCNPACCFQFGQTWQMPPPPDNQKWWCLNSLFIETFEIFLLLALLSGSYRFSGTPAKCNMKAQIPSHSKSHDTWSSYQRHIILANLHHHPIIIYVDYHIVNIFVVWSLSLFNNLMRRGVKI